MPSYQAAINWIVTQDDTEWLNEEPAEEFISVTAFMVACLWNKDNTQVTLDIRKAKDRLTKTKEGD